MITFRPFSIQKPTEARKSFLGHDPESPVTSRVLWAAHARKSQDLSRHAVSRHAAVTSRWCHARPVTRSCHVTLVSRQARPVTSRSCHVTLESCHAGVTPTHTCRALAACHITHLPQNRKASLYICPGCAVASRALQCSASFLFSKEKFGRVTAA